MISGAFRSTDKPICLPTKMLLFSLLFISIFSGPVIAEPPLLVSVVRVSPTSKNDVFSVSGDIVARDVVGLSFPMGGRILSVSVREGDHVTKGQELARLESVQQEQALRGVEAALMAAEADLFQSLEDFQRQKVFLERGATTQIKHDEAERVLRINEANVERATADLKRARKALADTFLRASADGTIIDRFADPGEVLAAARPVLELAHGDTLDAIFDVPESVPATIMVNTVELTLIDHPDVIFSGQVSKVSPLVDQKSGTVEVTVQVHQPPEIVRFGNAVRGQVNLSVPPRIAVPYSALIAYEQGAAVWVVDPQRLDVSIRPITISQYKNKVIVITSGLKTDDIVITTGAQLLYPGRIVKIREGS